MTWLITCSCCSLCAISPSLDDAVSFVDNHGCPCDPVLHLAETAIK